MKLNNSKLESLRSATTLSFLSLLIVVKIYSPNNYSQINYLFSSSTALCCFLGSIYYIYQFFMVKEDIAITNLQKIMSLITFGVIALYFSIKNFSLEFKQTPILWFCSVIAFTLGISSVSYAIRLAFWKYIFKKQPENA
jgi:cation transporter-like permease